MAIHVQRKDGTVAIITPPKRERTYHRIRTVQPTPKEEPIMSNAQKQSTETNNGTMPNDTPKNDNTGAPEDVTAKIADQAASTAANSTEGTTDAGAATPDLDSGTAATAAVKTSWFVINWTKVAAKISGLLTAIIGAFVLYTGAVTVMAYPGLLGVIGLLMCLTVGLHFIEDGLSVVLGFEFRNLVDKYTTKAVNAVTGAYKSFVGWMKRSVKVAPAVAEVTVEVPAAA